MIVSQTLGENKINVLFSEKFYESKVQLLLRIYFQKSVENTKVGTVYINNSAWNFYIISKIYIKIYIVKYFIIL